MSAIYRHEFIVPAASVDQNGHVNNVEYVKWMQEVAVMHSDTVGCAQATKEAGATWVARSHRIEYLRPAFCRRSHGCSYLGDQFPESPIVAEIQVLEDDGQRGDSRRRNRLGVCGCENRPSPVYSRKRFLGV